ncbi:MAG: hypothetical protein E7612_11105 [Ruminococcaceae bacterium]|nr:hypothetical protein [Oscillospiraceae bacterium]
MSVYGRADGILSNVFCGIKCKKIKKNAFLFLTGGIGYGLIEIAYRGYTHPTMLVAGGISFISFSYIAEHFREKSLAFKAALGALSVTALELLFGTVLNLLFKKDVWDYSRQPFNFLGQICPLFTLFWWVLSLIFIPFAELIGRKI